MYGERFGVGVEAGWLGIPEALPLILELGRRADPWGPHLFLAEDDGAAGRQRRLERRSC